MIKDNQSEIVRLQIDSLEQELKFKNETIEQLNFRLSKSSNIIKMLIEKIDDYTTGNE